MTSTKRPATTISNSPAGYEEARADAIGGCHATAKARFHEILKDMSLSAHWRALLHNDLGTLEAMDGDLGMATEFFNQAILCDNSCHIAADNRALLDKTFHRQHGQSESPSPNHDLEPPLRVAIVSFLFSWPSTAGGIVHTVELCRELAKAGYTVRHFYARHEPWGLGQVNGVHFDDSQPIPFTPNNWNLESIKASYRRAVDAFDPDYVLITDSWNFKPHLADALRQYPYFLRQQALELVCPLNNLCLLVDAHGAATQCPGNQLASPRTCADCLEQRGSRSGELHRAERALSRVGTLDYDRLLRRVLREAAGVLVLNPTVAERLRSHAPNVRVVTWGMDAARFPWPWVEEPARPLGKMTLFMAGLVDEYIKGFHVLHEACAQLWRRRRDFELVATGTPAGPVDEFTRFVGWLDQEALPRHLRGADIVVMPTIAQEGLGRSTVEAMGVGRPVVASRIGGLPHTVTDGVTGLLAEPGNATDLANKLEWLLDDPELRERMGQAGRARFERDFTWDVVIERDYRPLLARRRGRAVSSSQVVKFGSVVSGAGGP